jgi:hypothetical protein
MAVKKKETVSTGELGGSGTTIYGGVVSGAEYNTSLPTDYGGNGLRVYDKMRRSDPMVRAALFIIKLAILQAELTITIEDKSAQGEEIRRGCPARGQSASRAEAGDSERDVLAEITDMES